MLYSDYCKYAPQVRYGDFNHVKKQMYKLHVTHRESGYITKIDYQQTTDSEGKADWEMFYTPGPKAFTEYQSFTNRQLPQSKTLQPLTSRAGQAKPIQTSLILTHCDPELLTELTKRGITEAKARELLASVQSGQEVMDQLEYVDSLVANDRRGKLENPPGLYVMYIRDNTGPPANFCSSRKAKLYEEANQVKNADRARKARLEIGYADYREAEIQKFAEALDVEEYNKLFAARRAVLRPMFRSMTSKQLDDVAHRALHRELETSARVPLLSFEEFCKRSVVSA